MSMTNRVIDFEDGTKMLLIESSDEAVLVMECRHCRRTGQSRAYCCAVKRGGEAPYTCCACGGFGNSAMHLT